MSLTEHEASMDDFYNRMSEELYLDHKEQAIEEFAEERMQLYFKKNPTVIQAPLDCYYHAKELIQISPQ